MTLSKSPYQIAMEKPLTDQLQRFIEGRTTGSPDPLFMAGRTQSKRVLFILLNEYPDVVLEIEKELRGQQ